MFDFPSTTVVHQHMPKEVFYKSLNLTKALKDKFVSDVDRIVLENKLTSENMNLMADSDIEEILLLSISLKKQEFDSKIIEAIARQNSHKLAFLLIYENRRQLALYRGKLYRTPWGDAGEVRLALKGFSLDEIWESFVEQIALYDERAETKDALSLDERLARQEQILKLEKQIEKTNAAAWKEPQPKKQFEHYCRLRVYQKKLEELKRPKSAPQRGMN